MKPFALWIVAALPIAGVLLCINAHAKARATPKPPRVINRAPCYGPAPFWTTEETN